MFLKSLYNKKISTESAKPSTAPLLSLFMLSFYFNFVMRLLSAGS